MVNKIDVGGTFGQQNQCRWTDLPKKEYEVDALYGGGCVEIGKVDALYGGGCVDFRIKLFMVEPIICIEFLMGPPKQDQCIGPGAMH